MPGVSAEGELVIMASYCVRNCGTHSPYVKYGSFAFLISALYLIYANVALVSLIKKWLERSLGGAKSLC